MVLKQCNHLHFVPFYYGSAFHFISSLCFVSACFLFFSTWHKSQFGKLSLHVPVLLICNWLANSNIFHFTRDGVLDIMTQQEFQHKTDHGSHALLFMVPLGLPSARPMAQALRLPFEYYIYTRISVLSMNIIIIGLRVFLMAG